MVLSGGAGAATGWRQRRQNQTAAVKAAMARTTIKKVLPPVAGEAAAGVVAGAGLLGTLIVARLSSSKVDWLPDCKVCGVVNNSPGAVCGLRVPGCRLDGLDCSGVVAMNIVYSMALNLWRYGRPGPV